MAPTDDTIEIPDPRTGAKPEPIGNIPFIILLTTTTLCILFLIWRRAHSIKKIVSHKLKTWAGQEGTIRLSQDEGPSAASFLEDEHLDDADSPVVDELALQSRVEAQDWQQTQDDRRWKPAAPAAQDIADTLPRD